MQKIARGMLCVCGAILLGFLSEGIASADTLRITSEPSGALVEIDSVIEGKTPYEKKFPGGYFHRTRTVYGDRLGAAMHARISLEGYVTQELELTRGPMHWLDLKGGYHGDYYLLKSDTFHIVLDKPTDKFTGSVRIARDAGDASAKNPEAGLPPEKIVEVAGPAVVYLRGPEWSGTGFFVTETGVIATNAHVARGLRSMTAIDAAGKHWESAVVYVDNKLDLALLKVDGGRFPSLTLSESCVVRKGETVVAIGNPGGGMPNTVTRGVESAIGPLEKEPGTRVQSDAAINQGNRGGPLLNAEGQVIGINTLIRRGLEKDIQGINFALSADDLTALLARFYPELAAARESASRGGGTGKLEIGSTPEDADIYVDGKFIGTTPSTLTLATGVHSIRMEHKGFKEWTKQIEVLKDAQARLRAVLDTL